MIKLVLMRHGWSQWNEENRFTGWTDVDLHKTGVKEAAQAGDILKKAGYEFDIVYTSVLKRAMRTTKLALSKSKQSKVPVVNVWQLNERHYGGLQGLNKAETAEKFGAEQVLQWRRSYNIRPPALTLAKAKKQITKQYGKFKKSDIPLTESLADVLTRLLPWYKKEVVKQLKSGKHVLISAHGNSLRALIKYLDNVAPDQIIKLTLPTAIPLVYELDEKTLKPIRHYYLGDKKVVEARIAQAEYRMYHVDGK